MLRVNLNSKIINPANDLAWAFEQFQFGYDRYVAGDSYATCTSSEQQRGYLAANRHDAEASHPGYADLKGW